MGASGAPSPPAATSAERKSETTSILSAAAARAPSQSWRVRPTRGRCSIVWPCRPTSAMRSRAIENRSRNASTAATWASVTRPSSSSCGAWASLKAATTARRRCAPARGEGKVAEGPVLSSASPSLSISATSMPSIDVPLMTPIAVTSPWASLIVFGLILAFGLIGAGAPQHVRHAEVVGDARGDEQIIAEAIDIGQRRLADLLALDRRQRDHDPLRPSANCTRLMQRGGGRRAARQHERAQRMELRVERVDGMLERLNLRRRDTQDSDWLFVRLAW